jgi:hypothetical protein
MSVAQVETMPKVDMGGDKDMISGLTRHTWVERGSARILSTMSLKIEERDNEK